MTAVRVEILCSATPGNISTEIITWREAASGWMSGLTQGMKGSHILFIATFLLSLYTIHGKNRNGELVSKYGRRDPTLDDKQGTTPAFLKNGVRSLLTYATICEQDESCTSFFYNKRSQQCQGHDHDLDHKGQFDKSEGNKYYRMYENSNVIIRAKKVQGFTNFDIGTNRIKYFFDVPSLVECVEKCTDNPQCVSVMYNEEDRQTCVPYSLVFLSTFQAVDKWQGAEFYRHLKSFCDEDENYVIYPTAKICFKIHRTGSLTWEEAEARCKVKNGHLFTAKNEEENKLVTHTIIHSGFSNTNYHIGARKNDRGEYVSVNGDPDTFIEWKSGKPPVQDNRRCVYLVCFINRCRSEAVSCGTARAKFICEKDVE